MFRVDESPVCSEGSHECQSVSWCYADEIRNDCAVFCPEHLIECAGCKHAFCEKHAAVYLTKTDCGLLCETCAEEYATC